MRHICLFVIIWVLSSPLLQAKSNRCVIYRSPLSIEVLQLCHDTLTIKWTAECYGVTPETILTRCLVKKVNENFLEINSLETNPVEMIKRSEKIVYHEDSVSKDSVMIYFDFPNYSYNPVRIMISPEVGSPFVFTAQRLNHVLIMPKSTKSFSYILINDLVFLGFRGVSCQVLAYATGTQVNVAGKITSVFICQPALSNQLQESFYLKGEYIRMVGEKLIWRGNVYEKSMGAHRQD